MFTTTGNPIESIDDLLEFWQKQKEITKVQKEIAEARIEIQRQKKALRVHRDSIDGVQEELLAKLVNETSKNQNNAVNEDSVNDDGPEIGSDDDQFSMEYTKEVTMKKFQTMEKAVEELEQKVDLDPVEKHSDEADEEKCNVMTRDLEPAVEVKQDDSNPPIVAQWEALQTLISVEQIGLEKQDPELRRESFTGQKEELQDIFTKAGREESDVDIWAVAEPDHKN